MKYSNTHEELDRHQYEKTRQECGTQLILGVAKDDLDSGNDREEYSDLDITQIG